MVSKKANNNTKHEIAQKVKKCMSRLGYTQADLASKIGVSFQQMQRYKRGLYAIGTNELYAIMRHQV